MAGKLLYDSLGNVIQSHATDPNKCLGTKNNGTVFKPKPDYVADAAGIAGGTVVDITGWTTLVLYPASDGQVAYNGNAALVEPIYSGQANVLVIHPRVTQISINVNCIVTGM